MTSDEVKARLLRAYVAGMVNSGKLPKNRTSFEQWFKAEMPEVVNAEESYFDKQAENGHIHENFPGEYQKEWYNRHMEHVDQVGPFKLPQNVCVRCEQLDCICDRLDAATSNCK